MTKQIITAETVRLAWKAGESVIVYAKGDIVTQQAQDDARHYGITLTTETPVAPSSALAEPEAEAVPPVSPVLEEVPASQEPVHVPTPALTADQLAAAARQLQEALIPLTQALTASVAPAAQPVSRHARVSTARNFFIPVPSIGIFLIVPHPRKTVKREHIPPQKTAFIKDLHIFS